MSHHLHTPEPVEAPDAWHRHTPDEGAPQHEHGARANAIGVGLTLMALTFGFLFLILVVWVYFLSYTGQVRAERTETVTEALRTTHAAARADAQTRLTQPPAWLNRDDGTVTMPLSRARELVAGEYARAGASTGAEVGAR